MAKDHDAKKAQQEANQQNKLDKKEAKLAARLAKIEKKERIKQNKPKDPTRPNIFIRIGKAIARFFKEFRGTAKKVIWPDGRSVWKNSLAVVTMVLIVGFGVWVVDWALSNTLAMVLQVAEDYEPNAAEEEDESQNAEDNTGAEEDTSGANEYVSDSSSETEAATTVAAEEPSAG